MRSPQLISWSKVKLKAFPPRPGTGELCSFSPLIFNKALKILARASRQGEKGTPIEKEEVKLSLFVDDIILFIENSKDSTKITVLLEVIKMFQ